MEKTKYTECKTCKTSIFRAESSTETYVNVRSARGKWVYEWWVFCSWKCFLANKTWPKIKMKEEPEKYRSICGLCGKKTQKDWVFIFCKTCSEGNVCPECSSYCKPNELCPNKFEGCRKWNIQRKAKLDKENK